MRNVEEAERLLIRYIGAAQQAREVLSQLHGLEIRPFDIQSALSEVLNIPENPPLGILDLGLDSDAIVNHLKDFDFRKFHPEILSECELTEGVLPEGISLLLNEKTVKVKGEVWRMHQNDADPWPSNPHAHNYQSGIVANLQTGELFDTNRKSVGKLNKKKLARLREELGLKLVNKKKRRG